MPASRLMKILSQQRSVRKTKGAENKKTVYPQPIMRKLKFNDGEMALYEKSIEIKVPLAANHSGSVSIFKSPCKPVQTKSVLSQLKVYCWQGVRNNQTRYNFDNIVARSTQLIEISVL